MSDEGISNVPAEKQVLGSIMIQPAVAERVFTVITPSEFYVSAHIQIALILQRMHYAGEPVNPTAVLTKATQDGILGKIGGGPYLFELVQHVEVAMTAPQLAEDIHRCATRRAMVEVGARLQQRARAEEAEPLTILADVQATLADLNEAELTTSTVSVPSLREFLAQQDDEVDWVIPGLLAREDRFILTGIEGAGKMMLLRQLAVCAAAGLHPFSHELVEPRNVLLIDLENPAQIMRETIRKMVVSAMRLSKRDDVVDRVFVERRPEGINLAEPSNTAWLMKRVTQCAPDVLIIGPLYKMMNDNPNDEQVARAVSVALDLVRTNGNCALMVEAHAGHGNSALGERPVRPVGSSLWLRWPEFGYGLRYSKADDAQEIRRMDLQSWRGARGDRDWPRQLVADARLAYKEPDWDEDGHPVEPRSPVADLRRREARQREEDLRDLAGSGIQRSTPPEDRYWPDDSPHLPETSNGSIHPINHGARQPVSVGAGAPQGASRVSGEPPRGSEELTGPYSGSIPEEPEGDWALDYGGSDDEPNF